MNVPEPVQHDVEVILTKQLASSLATPIFLVAPNGDLVYFNEPAELLLGRRYDETDDMPQAEWARVFQATDENDVPLPPESLPLSIACAEHRPAHVTMCITGLDDVKRRISVTAFPLVGLHDRFLGAVAIFWEAAER